MMSPGVALTEQSRTGLGGIGSGMHRGRAGSRQSRSGGLVIARLRTGLQAAWDINVGGRGSIEKGHGLPVALLINSSTVAPRSSSRRR